MGSLVLNRFQITDRLGSGGFGVVYRAWDSRLERDVAVKVIEVAEDASSRVLREAQAAARLNHRGIVTLYELGEEDGRAYLVSELVDGATLQELSSEGRLCDREVAEIGADLCEALDHAHSRGVIHRDIKPHNVLVPAGDAPAKLMDFGIARVLDDGGPHRHRHRGRHARLHGSRAGRRGARRAGRRRLRPRPDPVRVLERREPHRRATPTATARSIGTPVASLGRPGPTCRPQVVEAIDASLEPEPDAAPQHRGAGHGDRVLPGGARGRAVSAAAAPRPRLIGFGEGMRGCEVADVASAAAASGLTAAAMISAARPARSGAICWFPWSPPSWLLRPRLGFLLAASGLAVWLLAASRPGAALLLALITLPPAVLIGGAGRGLMVPAAAPALGALGLAPAFPALAGLAGALARPRA